MNLKFKMQKSEIPACMQTSIIDGRKEIIYRHQSIFFFSCWCDNFRCFIRMKMCTPFSSQSSPLMEVASQELNQLTVQSYQWIEGLLWSFHQARVEQKHLKQRYRDQCQILKREAIITIIAQLQGGHHHRTSPGTSLILKGITTSHVLLAGLVQVLDIYFNHRMMLSHF